MAASLSVGALSSSARPSVSSRSCGQKATRVNLPVCRATKQEDSSSDRQHPLISAAVAASLAGALCFADVGAAQAQGGDVYERLGIERPTPGTGGGVVLKAPQKKALFQSGKPKSVQEPKPAPPPAPPPELPPSPPALETAKPASKQKKASKIKLKTAEPKKITPIEKPAFEKETTTQAVPSKSLEAPTPSKAPGRIKLEKPKLKSSPPSASKTSKKAAAASSGAAAAGAAGAAAAGAAAAGAAAAGVAGAAAAGAGAGAGAASSAAAGGGLSLPSVDLPSFQAPSLSAPSISIEGAASDTQQAIVVAGVEVALLLIVNSIVGGLFTKKKSSKA